MVNFHFNLTTAETDTVSLTEKQKQLIVYIDQQVNTIISNGGDEATILVSLVDIMDDLKEIIRSAETDTLDICCQKYDGFYRFMKIMETLAAGIADGSIPVPQKS